jgi:hypothetical protein
MNNQDHYLSHLNNILNERKKLSLEDMKMWLSNFSNADADADPIINGIIVNLIIAKLLPSGIPSSLLFQQIKEVVTDITQEHLGNILEFMAKKDWIRIDKEQDKILKNKCPMPNRAINI